MTKSAHRKRASFQAHQEAQAAYLKSQEKKVSIDSHHIVKLTKSAKAKRQSTIQKAFAANNPSGKTPSRRVSSYLSKDLAFFAPSEKAKSHAPMTFKVDKNLLSCMPVPNPCSFWRNQRRSRSAERANDTESDEGIQNFVPFSRYVLRASSSSPRARSLSAPPSRRYSTLEEHIMKRKSFISWNIMRVKEHGAKTNFAEFGAQVSKPKCHVKYMSPTKSSKVKRISYISPWSPEAAKKLEEDKFAHKPMRYMSAEAEERRKYTFQPVLETKKKSKQKSRSPSNELALGNRLDPRSPRERALARKKELEDNGRGENNHSSNEIHPSRSFVEYNIQRVKTLKPRQLSMYKEDETVFVVHGQIKKTRDKSVVEYERKSDSSLRPKRISYISPISPEVESELSAKLENDVESLERPRESSFHSLDLFASSTRERRPTHEIVEQMQKTYLESVVEASVTGSITREEESE